MSAYRTRTLYITPAHYAALRAFADMHMLDTPEDAAALWLEERIQSDARLLRFEREQRRVMKTLREEAATWEDTAPARITELSK